MESGPHLVVIAPKELIAQITDVPSSGGPYVMWTDTDYAHIMIPVDWTERASNAAWRENPSRRQACKTPAFRTGSLVKLRVDPQLVDVQNLEALAVLADRVMP